MVCLRKEFNPGTYFSIAVYYTLTQQISCLVTMNHAEKKRYVGILFGVLFFYIFFLRSHTLHAQGAAFVSDTFTRSVGSGWGTADTGGSYTHNVGSAFAVNGSNGTITLNAGNSRDAFLTSVNEQEVDYTARFQISAQPTGTSTNFVFTAIARRIDASNEYRGKVQVTNTNQITLVASSLIAGAETNLGSAANTGITIQPATWYRMRFQAVGTNPTTLRLRVWEDGSAEPGTWTYSVTNSAAALQTSGSVGARGFLHSSVTNGPIVASVDDITIESAIPDTPVPTATPTLTPSPTPLFFTASDSYTRIVSDSWGGADTGGAYTVTSNPADFDVNDSTGSITTNAGNSREIRLDQVRAQDIDYTIQVRTDKTPTGNYYQVAGLARRSPTVANYEYRLKYQFNTNGTVSMVASKLAGSSSETNIGSSQTAPGLTFAEDTWYNIRFQVTNVNPTLLRMKIWPVGDAEPADWGYSQTDSEPGLQASGVVGLRVFTHPSVVNAPVFYEFDNLNVSEFTIPEPTPPAACEPIYASYGPWRQPISDNPVYNTLPQYHVNDDPDEPLEAFVDTFDGSTYTYENLTSDTTQFTYPIYEVTNDTPTKTVTFSGYYSDVQDTNNDGLEDGTVRSSDPDFNGGTYTYVEVPIPDGAQAATGSDSQIVIVNTDTNEEWGFWRVDKDGDGIGEFSNGVINNDLWTPFNGIYYAVNGYRYNTNYTGYPPSNVDPGSLANFGSRGAGVSYYAGLIRPCEIIQGEINHALAFAYPLPSGDFVYPATKSDGQGVAEYELPEGARLQLDPSLTESDLTSLGCVGACQTIARALQEYGMYLIDISGRYKIMAEDEKTANWSDMNPSYQVTENTVASLTLDLFRLIEFPAEINTLQPIPTPPITPTPTPDPNGDDESTDPDTGTGGWGTTTSSAGESAGSNNNTCAVSAPSSTPWIFSAASNGLSEITLFFQESPDPVTHYALRFGDTSGDYRFGATNIGSRGTRSFTVSSLKPDTMYYFQIQGVNACNGSDWSNEMKFSTRSVLSFTQSEYRTENVELASLSQANAEPDAKTEISPTPASANSLPVTGSNILSDIRIQVLDQAGAPLKGARVTLKSGDEGKATDAQGSVLFTGMQRGDYNVTVQHNGSSATQKLAVTDAREQQLTITLNTQPNPTRWWIIGGTIGSLLLLAGILWAYRLRKP